MIDRAGRLAFRVATGSAVFVKDQLIEATIGLTLFSVVVAIMLALADHDQVIHHFLYKR